MDKQINVIGLIGSGKMGFDIFDYLLNFEYEVVWILSPSADAEAIKNKIQRKINRKNKNSANPQQPIFQLSKNLSDLKDCDMIIESISENQQQKTALFAELKNIISDQCLLTTNTSSLNLEEIKKNAQIKQPIYGLHFFYPLCLKSFCEINLPVQYLQDDLIQIRSFLESIQFSYLQLLEKERFIINKIYLAIQNAAFQQYIQTNITMEELDVLINENFYTGGVFHFFDQVGLDILYQSVRQYISEFSNPQSYKDLLTALQKMVEFQRYGTKNQKGFYRYLDNDDFQASIFKKNNSQFNKKQTIQYIKDSVNDFLMNFIKKQQNSPFYSENFLFLWNFFFKNN
ncbi:MAG: 3-hydroxyacyl-CoA dehydrogenase family protein [Spirochaetes bacterium]|nr:3-hydroxyacyl-CoA dehydrogenase family protein [Spirochaetota bacterium]